MFKRLLIASDLSKASRSLIDCLGALKAYGAEECLLLQCLNATEPTSSAVSYATNALKNLLQSQKETLEKQGYKVETRVVTGVPKKEIHRIATEENYNLIVVGSHEYSLASEVFFGNLAYDVIYFAQKPVLLIRMEETPGDDVTCIKTIGCDIGNQILFPTDFSKNADLAFNYVKEIVKYRAKKVTLLHVQDKYRISPYLEDRLDEFNQIDTMRLQQMKDILQDQGQVEVEILLRYGSPSVEVLTAVRELNVQLVVMGCQGTPYQQSGRCTAYPARQLLTRLLGEHPSRDQSETCGRLPILG